MVEEGSKVIGGAPPEKRKHDLPLLAPFVSFIASTAFPQKLDLNRSKAQPEPFVGLP